jgi:hypothetical protein
VLEVEDAAKTIESESRKSDLNIFIILRGIAQFPNVSD